MICRFLAALGIGGEWAVGAALLSETWPKRWRPWIAAALQSAVNIGVHAGHGRRRYLLAALPKRCVFLVGMLPALMVFWIRRAVPEPEEWQRGHDQAGQRAAADPRPVPRQGPPHHDADDPGLCLVADGPLGVHVSGSCSTCATFRTSRGWADAEKQQLRQPGDGPGDGHLDRAAISWPAGIAKLLGYRRAIA